MFWGFFVNFKETEIQSQINQNMRSWCPEKKNNQVQLQGMWEKHPHFDAIWHQQKSLSLQSACVIMCIVLLDGMLDFWSNTTQII